MNFGSTFALHDSDDEEEMVHEDIPSGPLSCMSPASFERAPQMPRSLNIQPGLFGSACGCWDDDGRQSDHCGGGGGRGGRGGGGGRGYQERSMSARHTQVVNNLRGSHPHQLESGNSLRPTQDHQAQDPPLRNMNRSASFAAPAPPPNKLSTRVPAVRMDRATSGTEARSSGLRTTGVVEEVVDGYPPSHLSPVAPTIQTSGTCGQAESARSSGRGRTWTRKVRAGPLVHMKPTQIISRYMKVD